MTLSVSIVSHKGEQSATSLLLPAIFLYFYYGFLLSSVDRN